MDRGYRIHICNVSETAPTTTICPDTTFCVPVSRPLDLNWVALLLRMEWFFYLVAKNEPQRKTRLVYCRCFGKVAFLENLKLGKCSHRYMACSKQILESTQWNPQFLSSSSTHTTHNIESLCLKKHSSPPKKNSYHLKTDRWHRHSHSIVLVYHGPLTNRHQKGVAPQPFTFTPRNFREVAPVPPALLVVVRLMDLVPVQQWALVAMQKPYTCSKRWLMTEGILGIYIYICMYMCIYIYHKRLYYIIWEYVYKYIYTYKYILYIYIYFFLYHVGNFGNMYIYIIQVNIYYQSVVSEVAHILASKMNFSS